MRTSAEFASLQNVTGQRVLRKGTGEIPSIITGLRIRYCGYCGSALVAQNLINRGRRKEGRPQNGHRRLICVSNQQGAGCAVTGSCSVVPIERAVMAFCADQMNLSRLLEGSDRAGGIAGQLSAARAAVAETSAKVEKITDAVLSAEPGQSPPAFMRRARELENQLAEQQAKVDALEHELATVATPPPRRWPRPGQHWSKESKRWTTTRA